MASVKVQVKQISPTSSEGLIRDHRVLIDRPEAKGGEDRGPMGGELLLASLGGCFMSTLLAAIRSREANVKNVAIELDGTLDGSPPHFTAITMHIQADYEDKAQMEKLLTISERSCIVANTLKGAVALRLELRDT